MNFSLNCSVFVITLAVSLSASSQISSGVWSTGCRQGLIKTQIYNQNSVSLSVSLTEQFHQDAVCSDESFRFVTTGEVAFNSEHPNWIDFSYSQVFLTIYKDVVIEDFNSRKVCGHSHWEHGRAENITGLRCALFSFASEVKIPSAGDFKYGIFLLENGHLYYGKLTPSTDGSTPLKRPVLLDRLSEYTLQNSF